MKGAYLTIHVHLSYQKFLRFAWKGRVFQFNCLAFGLAQAPRFFAKILKVVAAYLKKHGMRVIIYLDDILIMNSSKDVASADVEKAIDLLQHLGFLMNFDKLILDPVQVMEYLSLLIYSNYLSFALPKNKAAEVKEKCDASSVKGVN